MLVLNRHHLKNRPWPESAVYVGRGHPLGNPFVIGRDGDRAGVLRLYEVWLREHLDRGDAAIVSAMRALRADSSLVCSCAPLPCHGHIIAAEWQARYARMVGAESATD